MRIRKLTPVECERLQGYPDNWTKFGRKPDGKIYELSNIQRYKLCGNGISSPVSKHILETVIKDSEVKIMSLFSGTAGTEQLLDPARFKVVGHSEFDKHASANLHYNFPDIPNYGDITEINGEELPDFNMLAGGFPCQAWSESGLRKGFDDTSRGQLIYDVFRIVKNTKPKYILLENVKGLITHNKGKSILAIFEGLSNLGYSVDFNLVNSKDFGLAQNRMRIFIICVRNDVEIEEKPTVNKVAMAQRLAELCKQNPNINYKQIGIPNNNGMPTPNIADILEDNVDEKYFLRHEAVEKIANEANHDEKMFSFKSPKNPPKVGRDIAYCIDANYSKGSNTTTKNRRQLIAYSKSTREHHIDHRAKLNVEANTLSTGDGCGNMSTQNFVMEEK